MIGKGSVKEDEGRCCWQKPIEELLGKDLISLRIVRTLDQTELQKTAVGRLRPVLHFIIKHQTQSVMCAQKMSWVMGEWGQPKSQLTGCFDFQVTVGTCLSYHSVAMKRHHDQVNLQKKAFNWELAYSFRSFHYHHDRELAIGRQVWCWSSS